MKQNTEIIWKNCFYNGAQGARKKDERAIAYLSSPNQIYATDVSSSSFKDFQVYSPCFYVACCPVNSIVLLPEFVRGMMLYDENNDIYMTAYGPCSLDWNGIKIVEKTQYPFRNKIDFIIETKNIFPFILRFRLGVINTEWKLTEKKCGQVTFGRALSA